MSRHWLVIEGWEDGEDHPIWSIEHEDCPVDQHEGAKFEAYGCAVQWEVENVGIDAFGLPLSIVASWPEGLPTKPGRYEVEHWHEVHRGFDWTEHDTGLRLVEAS